MTNTATVRCFRRPRATYAVFCQAEDREFEQLGAVFRAMTASLLSDSGSDDGEAVDGPEDPLDLPPR